MNRFSFGSLLVLVSVTLCISGCSTSLGSQLGMHKMLNDEMIFDTIKAEHDQKIVDHYASSGQDASTALRWIGVKTSPDQGGLLDELRKEMVIRNPDWPKNVKEAILKGTLVRGMTATQVLASWGRPTGGQKDEGSEVGGHEIWQYIAHRQQTTSEALRGKFKIGRPGLDYGGVKYYGMVQFRKGKVISWKTFF